MKKLWTSRNKKFYIAFLLISLLLTFFAAWNSVVFPYIAPLASLVFAFSVASIIDARSTEDTINYRLASHSYICEVKVKKFELNDKGELITISLEGGLSYTNFSGWAKLGSVTTYQSPDYYIVHESTKLFFVPQHNIRAYKFVPKGEKS